MARSVPNGLTRSMLSNFVILEAAARLGGFSRAAEELNLTQSAISHAVRKMEELLGAKLFIRGQSLRLTPDGEKMLRCAEQCILLTDAAITAVSYSPKPQKNALLVAVSTSMARHWLLPRIPEIMAAIPQLRLWVQTVDRDVDLYAEGVDLNIVFGSGDYPHYDHQVLWPERIVAVCSPEFLRQHGPFDTLQALRQAPLIHYEERVRARMRWAGWFTSQGIDAPIPESEVRYTDYALVLEAAMAGRGVALGWYPIIDDLLSSRRLVMARPEFASGHQKFSLLAPKGAFGREPVRQFCLWLKNYC
jgi:DNA-binding transcriptional LysR family regulator